MSVELIFVSNAKQNGTQKYPVKKLLKMNYKKYFKRKKLGNVSNVNV